MLEKGIQGWKNMDYFIQEMCSPSRGLTLNKHYNLIIKENFNELFCEIYIIKICDVKHDKIIIMLSNCI